jgi:TPR repeat protein
MPGGDIQDLIREGNRHMREGDILKAREFYEQAVQTGNAEAALAMGRSFDPSYFDRLERRTGEPDPAKAFEWYREAMNAGLDRAAQVRIENLRRYLNR